jgi:hypothetical protein
MEVEAPIQIDFQYILESKKYITDPHPRDTYFKELIASYACFQEKPEGKFSKWNHGNKKNHSSSASSQRKTERPKIGVKDLTVEGTLRKEFISLLNKLSNQNLDTMIRQTRLIFNKDHMDVFVEVLWEYLKRQPDYQGIYIQLLESIYQLLGDDDILDMNLLWTRIWNKYIQEEGWKIEYELIEQSHNYDDFCEYMKEKKKRNAISQAWSRLIGLGVIRTEPFEWMLQILDHSYQLDLHEHAVHKTMVDSYIEQIREYYKVLPKHIMDRAPSHFFVKIHGLKELEIQKASYFKVLDFLETYEKNENHKKITVYTTEDGL